jgi:20S proteasome subunit alpha 5
MIEHARVEAQNHAFNYAEPLRVESCTQAICDLALRFGEGAEGEESIMSRPFGVALLIAGFDEDGPSLYVRIYETPACLLVLGIADGVEAY